MRDNELTPALTMRVSAATRRGLQRLALQEPRSLAGPAAYLLEQTRTLPGGDADAVPAAEAVEAARAAAPGPRSSDRDAERQPDRAAAGGGRLDEGAA